MQEIIITAFTDPVCVWCWATEPVFRALETRYPGSVALRQVMGGLVPDIRDFQDADNHIDSREADVNGQIMAHWLESAAIHRMPIEPRGFQLFGADAVSSYPQNIACKAAQLVDERRAEKYIRLMRLATLCEARQTGSLPVQLQLAQEAGIDVAAFRQALEDGSAGRAFRTDLGLVEAMGVSVFPTFRVKSSRARQVMMRGYNTLEDFQNVFSELSGGTLKPLPSPPEEEVLRWLMDSRGPLSQEEIYAAFDFADRAEADRWVASLLRSGGYVKREVGPSYLLGLAQGA